MRYALWALVAAGCIGGTGADPGKDTAATDGVADTPPDTSGSTPTEPTPTEPEPTDPLPACVDEDLGAAEPVSYGGTTAGEADDFAPSCVPDAQADRAFQFTPPRDGTYTFSTVGSSFDTVLAVYDGCGGAELACSDDAVDLASEVALDLVAGAPVVVVVDGFDAEDEGPFELAVWRIAAEDGPCDDQLDQDADGLVDCVDPDCDGDGACAAACPDDSFTGFPTVFVGTTRGQPDERLAGCNSSVVGASDVSLEYVAPTTRTYGFALTDGTWFDAVLSVTDGCDGAEWACSDTVLPRGGEAFTLPLDAGQAVTLHVDGWEGASGTYELVVFAPTAQEACADGFDDDVDGFVDCDDLDCVGDPACTEDCGNGYDDNGDYLADCQDPQCVADPIDCGEDCTNGQDDDLDGLVDCTDPVCDGASSCASVCPENGLGTPPSTVVSSTLGENDDHSGSCGSYQPNTADVTYSFTAPAAGTYTFHTAGSPYDTVLYVLSGCGGTELACNDDVGYPDLSSRVQVALTAGQFVVVVVDGFSAADAGDYTLTVE